MSSLDRRTLAALAGVVLGLLMVGVVSHTPLRHLIQVVPGTLAATLVVRRVAWARYAALPVFVFWFLIMTAIWLFLLGIARVLSGHFSPAEVVLTVVIGAASAVGIAGAVRREPRTGVVRAALAVLAFAALQIGATWLSTLPTFANS